MTGLERDTKTDLGVIRIYDEVISSIASLAAKEVRGILKTGGGFTNNLYEFFVRGSLNKGVRVNIVNETEVKLDVWITVEYGVNIPQVALLVQENIKKSIEKMTGLNILDVNVNVQSVQPPVLK